HCHLDFAQAAQPQPPKNGERYGAHDVVTPSGNNFVTLPDVHQDIVIPDCEAEDFLATRDRTVDPLVESVDKLIHTAFQPNKLGARLSLRMSSINRLRRPW